MASLKKDYVFRNPKWKDRDAAKPGGPPKRRPPNERMTTAKVKKALKNPVEKPAPLKDTVLADPGTPPPSPSDLRHGLTAEPTTDSRPSPDQPPTNSAGDQRGMHLTPEQAKEIRKKRTFYPKLTPPIACDSCSFTNVCSYYKPGYECAFTPFLRQHGISSIEDIKDAAKATAEANGQRFQLSLILERLSGTINPETTNLSEVFMGQLERTKNMLEDAPTREESSGGLEFLKSIFDFSKSMQQPSTTVNVAVVTNATEPPKVAIEEKSAGPEIAELRRGPIEVQAVVRDPVKNPDP